MRLDVKKITTIVELLDGTTETMVIDEPHGLGYDYQVSDVGEWESNLLIDPYRIYPRSMCLTITIGLGQRGAHVTVTPPPASNSTRQDENVGYQIIKQPNEKLAIFSSSTDTIIVWDATADEVVDWFVEIAAERARTDTRRVVGFVEAGKPRKVYYQFTMTWEEATRSDQYHEGTTWQELEREGRLPPLPAGMCCVRHDYGDCEDDDGWCCASCPNNDPRQRPKRVLTTEQREALTRHGYDPDLPARGVTGQPEQVTVGAYGIRLRNRVCTLDGIEIDGHEGSDLDPNSTCCIHCDYEGPNP